jgi:hypothetical protein
MMERAIDMQVWARCRRQGVGPKTQGGLLRQEAQKRKWEGKGKDQG